MEADFVTGPAKNLIEFAQRARETDRELPVVELSVAAYRRGSEPESAFIQAARQADLTVDIITERGRFDRSVIEQVRRIAAADRISFRHNVKSHFFLRWSGIFTSAWLAFHRHTAGFKMRCYMRRWCCARRVMSLQYAGRLWNNWLDKAYRGDRLAYCIIPSSRSHQ
jgi:hypothetical protein